MDMFVCSGPHDSLEVDLDDLKIYPVKLIHMSTFDLHTYCWEVMGKSLFYTQYFHPDIDFGPQNDRVDLMCKKYAAEWRSHLDNIPENRLWFLKLIYKFEDEVENQC